MGDWWVPICRLRDICDCCMCATEDCSIIELLEALREYWAESRPVSNGPTSLASSTLLPLPMLLSMSN